MSSSICSYLRGVCCILAASILFNSIAVSAETNSTRGGGGYSIKDETTGDGTVVGAMNTMCVYSEPSITSDVIDVVIKNQIIRVLGETDEFYRVRYSNGDAFVLKSLCAEGDDLVDWILTNESWYTKDVEIVHDNTPVYDWVSGGHFRSTHTGDRYQLKEELSDYYVAIYTTVSATGDEENTLISIPKSGSRIVQQVHVTSFGEKRIPILGKQRELVEYACSLVGTPYVWGGNDPATGVDCSGFVRWVYNQFGYNLPRCSWEQATVGTPVPLDQLQPGDLIFYKRGSRIGHVTLYVGSGECVQARGRDYGVCITPYDYSTPLCAVRIFD